MASPAQQERVIFPGFVPHQNMPQFYQNTTIYIAPTQYETFGYTILEAMACGRPTITTPVGAVPELIEDGVHGFLVPFGNAEILANAIEDLLSKPKLMKRMGTNAREKASDFSLEKIGGKLESFYAYAVSKAGNNAHRSG
jgi:glycosyltransferase involved in cell wall biosynthesis